MKKKYDFSGWATRNDVLCTDGRIIRKDAFAHLDGKTVPVVWSHQHADQENFIGHAELENRPEGVYAYCSLNNTPRGQMAKEQVVHGDLTALSIWANQLKQIGQDVMHGMIREVSLVMVGANPGAFIDSVLEHTIEGEDGATIYTGEELELFHAEDEDKKDPPKGKTLKEAYEAMSEENQAVCDALVGLAMAHGDQTVPIEGKTLKEAYEAMPAEHQAVCDALVGLAMEHADQSENLDDVLEHKYKEGDGTVKRNAFDQSTNEDKKENILSHADESAIFADIKARKFGSLKDATLSHGITDVEFLFPDAKTVTNVPGFIQRDMTWVQKVMGGVRHTPFSRIKSVFADITEDDARAKGYIKGNLKVEEVFSLLKRTTDPFTVYKKQKLERDDVIDITDFDVVAWLKAEMRMMLDEELARAFLVGDGRLNSSNDKIDETKIRPIWKDADLYTIKADVSVAAGATADVKAKAFERAAVKSRKDYKGSGSPTLFTTEDMLTDMLLREDTMGRKIYSSINELAIALRVREIVTSPVLENLTRTRTDNTVVTLMGLIVNLTDYNVGADKGGAVNMFDDFDIDYNAMKYLIETRCSGALIQPYSAIALELVVA